MKNKLNILWTNADPVTSEHMVMMYTKNAIPQGWWDEVKVIIWGATAKLVAENTHIQSLIEKAQQTGVQFTACESCATELGVKQKIKDLGIELRFMGAPLTEILKRGEKLITI